MGVGQILTPLKNLDLLKNLKILAQTQHSCHQPPTRLPYECTTKLGNRRFIHACGDPGLCLSGSLLDRSGDIWGLIELGELVLPGTMLLYVPLDGLSQIAAACPLVMPCPCVMDITERPRNRVGPGTVRREPAHLQAGVTGPPRCDGLGFMHTIILDDDVEAGHAGGRGRRVQPREKITT